MGTAVVRCVIIKKSENLKKISNLEAFKGQNSAKL